MNTHLYIQVVVVLILMTAHCMTETCPQKCECTGKMDTHFTAMSCKGRDAIPPCDNIYLLNMSGNSLTVLNDKSFARASQLKILDLSFNKMNGIENGAMRNEILPHLLSLNLSDNYLTSFPKNLTSSLEHLQINSNNMMNIYMSDLCHLGNLRALYLDDNKITQVMVGEETKGMENQCVNGMPTLEVLSLRNNNMVSIDKAMWKYMSHVQYLSFANNGIKSVKAESFKGLRMLKYLDLSSNKIKTVAPKAILHLFELRYLSLADNVIEMFPEELPIVEWFDISHNHIREIPEGKKNSLYPQEVFLIGQNPLHCDCAMLWVKEFYDTREYQLKFVKVETEKFIPTCSTPDHLHGDTWDVLANDAFGCNQHVQGPTSEEEDDKLVWKLRDLSIKVIEVGDTFLKVEWDSVNIGVQSSEKHVIFFHIHPFGKKNQRKSVSVHPQIGRYVLKALIPEMAYIVCMSLMTDKSTSPVNSFTSDDCIEIVTKKTTVYEESWIMYMLRNPTFYLFILALTFYCVYRSTYEV